MFCLPHHTVLRQDSIYTKCRIVFDASAHNYGQLSLNNFLDASRNLIPNIFHLLLNFRLNKIAIVDIEKAFLQISINENDKDVFQFLFVESKPTDNEHFLTLSYQFRCQIFCLNASPFFSANIKKHITSFQEEYPVAMQALNNFCMVQTFPKCLNDFRRLL